MTDGAQGKDPRTSIASAYQKAGPYLSASWQLTGSVGLWTAVGYFLDRKLHTSPWCLLAGSLLGLSLGFYLFIRAVLALGSKEKADASGGGDGSLKR